MEALQESLLVSHFHLLSSEGTIS